jgi:hypothetical protein
MREAACYDDVMSESNGHGRTGRWQRRERRKQTERQRQQKHGATLKRVYRDAILKRLKARKKR